MKLALIVAVASNGVIGRENALPWRLPEDLQRFKSLTMGHHLIMGRRTFESLGRLLPGRTSVIVTRDRQFQVPGAIVVHSWPAALAVVAHDEEPFVIGGASLFNEALPFAETLYLTRILQACPGDTSWDLACLEQGWKRTWQSEDLRSKIDALPYRYENYERIVAPPSAH